uniref:40 kDa protein n=1 Tax=Isotomurus maculatus TaxID=36143 RepID=B7TK81_9HEXA|nr:40 kDa protein [Isotomurus maculatus]
MERGTRDLDLFGHADQEKQYLDELNVRLADVVEFNGQCGTGNGSGGSGDFQQRLEIIMRTVREEAERQSRQSAREIEVLRRELTEKNTRIETITRERDDFRTRWERCTQNSELLRQEIRTWQEKYEAEAAKNRTLQKAVDDERQKNQRLQKQVEELTARLELVIKEKREAETAWRVEKERYERTIAELKAVIATHGSGSGKPCDPQVWERKLRKLLEEMRRDFERKLEEYKKKYDELKKQEINGKLRELEVELRRIREELTSARGDVQRMRETIHKLESEKVVLLRRIEELESTGDAEVLRREIEKLKVELTGTRKHNQDIINRYGSALDRRVHIQAGLQKYDSLVKVEEVRIQEIRSTGSSGGGSSGGLRPRPRPSGDMGILDEIVTADVAYGGSSASSGFNYDYRRDEE